MRRVGSRGRVTVLTGYMRHPGFFWQIVGERIYRIGKSSPHSPTHVIHLLWSCQLAPRTDHAQTLLRNIEFGQRMFTTSVLLYTVPAARHFNALNETGSSPTTVDASAHLLTTHQIC